MLVRTHHIASVAGRAVAVSGAGPAASYIAKHHATLPGAVRLDGSILLIVAVPPYWQPAPAGGAEAISPPAITAAASPATMCCFMALSFASLLEMRLLLMWGAIAVSNESLLSRPVNVPKRRSGMM
jgi:hypothetical protein